MKTLLLTGFLAITAFGQTRPPTCNVAVDDIPPLQSVRLRMPVSELLKLPVMEKPSGPPIGARDFQSVERVQISGTKDRPAFSLRTFDDKVFSLVIYNERISTNIDAFVQDLSLSHRLPLDHWFKHSNSRIISCMEFEVTVNPTPNIMTLLDLPAFKKVVRAPQTREPRR